MNYSSRKSKRTSSLKAINVDEGKDKTKRVTGNIFVKAINGRENIEKKKKTKKNTDILK
jgi:hypothetical protein